MESQDLAVAGVVFLILAGAGILYTLAASVLIGRFATPVRAGSSARPAVSLLKPLHGSEPDLAANLESFLAQDYPASVQMVLGMQDRADPAGSIAESVRAAHPDAVDVVVSAREHGSNRKVSNLINLTAAARNPLLVQTDSDIAVDRGYLARIAACFDDPEVGLVTSLYYGRGGAGGWSRFAAMNLSYVFLPSVALGVALGMARPTMGSTIALTRQTLEAVGGFESVADVLADDYEIGRAVRGLGRKTVVASGAVLHVCSERTLGEVWRHELRWARTVRGIDPGGFFGSFVTHATPLALVGALLTMASPVGWTILAATVAARLWLMRRVDVIFGARSGPWWMLPVRDMMCVAVFVGAFFVKSVDWRGARYHVGQDGELSPTDPPTRPG